MSTLKVEVVQVEKVEPHPNADRLEIATIKGWQCVVGKGEFKAGDLGFYFPIDSVLPEALLTYLFSGTKLKPPSRIKTIKLRGAISQGLLVKRVQSQEKIAEAQYWIDEASCFPVGADMTERFGVTKYEPPQGKLPNLMKAGQTRVNHPDFPKFTDIENWKNYTTVFDDNDYVIVTEKIHGTNFRCGWVPFFANTTWKRIKKFFGFAPEWEFVFGSRNVQLTESSDTFYHQNVYAEIVRKYELKEKLLYGEVLYGEIYGDGIQKGFNYGCEPGEHKFAAFDMIDRTGEWMHGLDISVRLEARGIPMVPCFYVGPLKDVNFKLLAQGHSAVSHYQPVKEGVVIRSLVGSERHPLLGRKILKVINDEYLLLKDNSDWH